MASNDDNISGNSSGEAAQDSPPQVSAHPPVPRTQTVLGTADNMKDAIVALLALGGTVFVGGLVMMAANRPAHYTGSIAWFYIGICVAGVGGMSVTAGLVGIVVRLGLQSPMKP
jgi:hypothetical protein